MRRHLIALTLLCFSMAAYSRTDAMTLSGGGSVAGYGEFTGVAVALQGRKIENACPNPGRMDRLCQYLRDKTKDQTPNSDYNFEFQRIVYDASCVDYVGDSDEEISEKVNAMWDRYGESLRCGPMGLPSTGSPLRYAIHVSFNEFITEALSVWKLDLNKIEDGQTMLDFLDYRIERSSGAVKRDLQLYRESFISAGAKKRSQLQAGTPENPSPSL